MEVNTEILVGAAGGAVAGEVDAVIDLFDFLCDNLGRDEDLRHTIFNRTYGRLLVDRSNQSRVDILTLHCRML